MLRSELHPDRNATVLRSLSLATAALIATGGYIHFCLYRHGYRAIPKIGVGFLLQVVTSGLVAAALLIPWHTMRFRHHPMNPITMVRLGAATLSLGTLVAFALSRRPGGLFNFQERGLQPAPQALIALVTESAALVLAVASLLLDHRQHQQLVEARVTRGPTLKHG
jgi:hypothetical protein